MKTIFHPDSIARFLAAAFGAVITLTVAIPVAQYLNYQLAPPVQWLIAAAGAGVAFMATSSLRNTADFVNDCMRIPTAGPGIASEPLSLFAKRRRKR